MRTSWLLLAVASSVFAQNSTTVAPTATSPGPLCPNACQISVAATQVTFPYRIIYATTTYLSARVDVYLDSQGRPTRWVTSSRYIPSPATHVWVHAGVTLTYPTIYSQYSKFNYFKVEPVATGCSTTTASLTLPAPTKWGPLILPTGSIPDGAFVAPEVVGYLNGLSTVTEQLGGTIQAERACAPFAGQQRLRARQSVSVSLSTTMFESVPVPGTETVTITSPERQETTNFPSFTRFTNSTTQSSTQAPSSAEPSSSSVLPSSSATLSSSDLASSSDLPSASDFPLSSQVTTAPPLPPVATSVVNVTVTLPPVRTTSRPIENPNAAVPARQILALGGIEVFLIGAAGMLLGWL